jgi:tyrosyl-tRNA synthetase
MLVHGEADYNGAVEASLVLFNGKLQDLAALEEATFREVFEGVPQFSLPKAELESGTGVLELLAEKTNVFPSKSEARKMIQGGGVSINKEKVTSHEQIINASHLLNNKYLVIQKGKKNYYLCSVN